MTLRVTYSKGVGKVIDGNPESFYIAVCRHSATFTYDLWALILSPSSKLMDHYFRKRISLEDFIDLYKAEIDNPKAKALIKAIQAMSETQDVTVVCTCRRTPCFRTVLKEMITGCGQIEC